MKLNAAARLRATQEDVTYEQYCAALTAALNDGEVTALSLPSVLLNFFTEYKKYLSYISEHLKLSKEDVVAAFKERSVFKFLSAIKFSLKAVLQAMKATAALMHHGIMAIIQELEASGAFKHVQKSAQVVDEFLNKYPLLKKLAGPALAGLLIWIWFNMSFSGNVHSDLALGSALDALRGHFSIYDLFASQEGIAGLVLLATGMSGVSLFNYLSESSMNFIMALFYTAAHKLNLHVRIPSLFSKLAHGR